ncbi:charged multivesicular body protein 1a-like [Ylistrum balloti]|uniref:charged multivesicular body protein 1a-like n=1 Tax=Ylistrum balloti TaxID=509963 RepID=UPI002905C1E1|nr:charged multivesicular body protein 1a-like [Ylistrum balloti]
MGSKLDDALFNLKFNTKQMERFAKKAEKEHVKEKAKVKKAIAQKNIEAAKIYAENAIRKRNEGLSYLRMAARLDGVASRVQTAVSMKSMVKGIEGVSKSLEKAMSSMNLAEVDKVMQKFERQFEDLDVQTSTLENTMGDATTLSAPTEQVDDLIKQVAEESGLEMMDQLSDLSVAKDSVKVKEKEHAREDDLSRRLQALRN